MSSLYLITAVLVLVERNRIKTDIQNSPLLYIDDTLTEEIYNNIIQQGKSPGDTLLVLEYNRLKTNSIREPINPNNSTQNVINNPY